MLAGPANAKVGLDMQSIHSGETPVKDKKEGARRAIVHGVAESDTTERLSVHLK